MILADLDVLNGTADQSAGTTRYRRSSMGAIGFPDVEMEQRGKTNDGIDSNVAS
jgi:hypothetical protein